MTRLIDADALIPMMKYATTDSEIGVFPIKIGFDAIAEVINSAQTVEAEPVRHGKWLPREEGVVYPFWERYTCSECGEHSDDKRYCPECGARMDKDV